MAYDCVIINFNNSESEKNIDILLRQFPYANVVPFVSGYFDIMKSVLPGSTTDYTWVLSSKIDYTDFDFEYRPEQHQMQQLHSWCNKGQKEGDTFLVPDLFMQQEIKFLRDYQDINYHECDFFFFA